MTTLQRFIPALALAVFPLVSAAESFICTPENVASFGNRVHVRCTAATNGIRYFALPTTNAEAADRLVSLASTALVSDKRVRMYYTPNDTSGTTFGCLASDCRKATGIEFVR